MFAVFLFSFICAICIQIFPLNLETFSSEKRELINEVVHLKKVLEEREFELRRRETELESVKAQLATSILNVKESDKKVNSLNQKVNKLTLYFCMS